MRIMLFLIGLFQVAPSTEPASKVWDLPGLHGTAQEIRTQLYGEIDQFRENIKSKHDAIDQAKHRISQRLDELASLKKPSDSSYAYVCDAIKQTEAQLEQEKNPVAQAHLRAKLEGFMKRRAAMERQLGEHDPEVLDLRKRITACEQSIKSLEDGLTKAHRWRREIANALRGKFLIKMPVVVGTVGVIGKARIMKVEDGVVSAEGQLFQPPYEDSDQREGIRTLHGKLFNARYILSGLDADQTPIGSEVYIDQAVRVTSFQLTGETATLVAEHENGDIDELMFAFREWLKQ